MPTISFELKNVEGLDISGLVTKLAQGVKEQTEAVRLAWLQRVESEGRPRLKVYAEALGDSAIEYPVGGDPLYGQVIIRDNPRVRRLEEGGPQWDMKCIASRWARVFTVKGWVPIGDIKVDDLVLSCDGKFHRVLTTMKEPLEIGEEIIALPNLHRGHRKPLLVTANHPFLKNKEWSRAGEIKDGDILSFLGHACEQCGSPALWLNRFCSRSCDTRSRNLEKAALGLHPMQQVHNRERQSRWARKLISQLIREGRHASVNPAIQQKIKEDTERKLSKGDHAFQKEDNHHKAAKGLGRTRWKGSSLEDAFENELSRVGIVGYARQRKIGRNNGRSFYPDFIFPEHKLVIELLGERYHTKQEDESRQREIEALGWSYLSIWSKDFYRNREASVKQVQRLIFNHEGQYCLAQKAVVGIERRQVGKYWSHKYKYNLTVEDAGSYFVEGYAVHNSGLLAGPKARTGKRGQKYNIIPIGFSTESGFDAWQFHGVSPFRVVSSRSPANSWMYPAQEGFHFIADVVNDMRPVVARALSRILEEWQR